jgi:hypothetical protein
MDNNKKEKEVKKLINKDSPKSESNFLKNLKNYIEVKKSQNKVLKKIIENLTDNRNK